MRKHRKISTIESLEPRRMLTRTFTGTAGPDTIEIDYSFNDNQVHVVMNGVDNPTEDGLIVINAMGGDDTVLVHRTDPSLNVNYVVNAGDGNDRLMNPGHTLGVYIHASSFVFDGGPGFDAVIADNSLDFLQDARVQIQSDGIIRAGPSGNFFRVLAVPTNVERLEYLDSASSNRIEFRVSAFEQVAISGNDGNDLITNIPEGGFVAQLVPYLATVGMTINGGGGNDVLSLEDESLNVVERLVTIGGSTLVAEADGVTSGLVNYSAFEVFDFLGNVGDDHVVLRSQPTSTMHTINTQDGNDTVQIGGGDLDSGGFSTAKTSIVAGNGTDSIEFDDRLDGIGETEVYTFSPFTLTKGSAGITYSAFESQTLLAADGGVQPFQPSTIDLNSFSAQIESTTITGGANRPNNVNVSAGNLTSLPGALAVILNGAGGTINFNDQSAAATRSYQLSAIEMTSPRAITFSGATALNLNGGPFNDNLIISGAAPGTAATFNGNLGNDVITVSGGLVDFASPITVNGNGGTDTLRFSSVASPDLFTGTLRNNSFVSNGFSHSYATCESVVLQTGAGGSDITIHSVPVLTPPAISLTAFIGGGGADLLTVGTGNLGNIDGNVTVQGGGGSDTLVINDSTSSGASTYTFDQGNRFFKGSSALLTIVRSGVEREILQANNGGNIVNVTDVNDPLTILSNGGNDSINVQDSIDPVTVNTGGETASATAPFGDSINISSGMTAIIDQSDAVLGLSIASLATLRIAEGGVLDKLAGTGSTFSLAGTIDLAGGALLSRAGGQTPSSLTTLLTRGYNGGAWNGTNASGAIHSSLAAGSAQPDAVGYGLGSEIAINAIGGFSIAASDTLLRYTSYGDTDLNGVVNFDDYARTDNGFLNVRTGWGNGDFDFNGVVNFDDYALIDLAFLTQGSGRGDFLG